MQDDSYADRKKLTFAQAEGAEPLPRQLALGEVSPELRSRLWHIVHESLAKHTQHHHYAPSSLGGKWPAVLYRKHVVRDHRMADEFKNSSEDLTRSLKKVFSDGSYVEVFDLLQWLLRQPDGPINPINVQAALETSHAAYRLLDDYKTIVPITDDAERQTLNRAFADLAASEFQGARAHLQNAAQLLTAGKSADSIRESIHAVESVARTIAGTSSLAGALQRLESKRHIHAALKRGFTALYGFTSDEKGIRHPLLDDGTAKVDETDAIFMIGACASFVSYLINKHKATVGS
jgi:hypothetical protein